MTNLLFVDVFIIRNKVFSMIVASRKVVDPDPYPDSDPYWIRTYLLSTSSGSISVLEYGSGSRCSIFPDTGIFFSFLNVIFALKFNFLNYCFLFAYENEKQNKIKLFSRMLPKLTLRIRIRIRIH